MTWSLAGKIYQSRFLLGTANYPNLKTLEDCLIASQAEICTVAIRRVQLSKTNNNSKSSSQYSSQCFGIYDLLNQHKIDILPNTAGCFTAKEAILTAELARQSLNTDLVKLEVIEDQHRLLPNSLELLKAAEILIRKGFQVLAYAPDSIEICKRLEDIGCAAVMPMGSPIGSGQGIRQAEIIQEIVRQAQVPVIIDAGLGKASDTCLAMELGCDAVLMNTAISNAQDPAAMATAMREAIDIGIRSREAGPIPEKTYATASSPDTDRLRLSL